MALFGRSGLPHRAPLSRFLAALDEPFVEALRSVFLHAALVRLGPEANVGGLWDRQATRWTVFDVAGTRQAARQRALPASGLTCRRRNDVCQRSVHLATWGVNVGKLCAPVPHSGPRSYPSVALHQWSSRQWRRPRRVGTGTQRDRCLSDRIGVLACSSPRSTRRTLWQWNPRCGSDRCRSRLREGRQRLCPVGCDAGQAASRLAR